MTAGARASWVVGFTSSSAGALTAGGTITTIFNGGFTIPTTPAVTLGAGFRYCTAAAATVSTTVTITLSGASCVLPANNPALLSIAGLTNPAANTYAANTFSVQTSVDSTSAVNPGAAIVIPASTSPSAISFAGSPQTAGARSTWTLGFTAGSAGSLAAGDTITAVLNSGFTVPATPAIVLGTGFSNCSATATAAAQTVTVTLVDSAGTCAVAASAAATFTVVGLTNPAAATYAANTFSIKTSADSGRRQPRLDHHNRRRNAADGCHLHGRAHDGQFRLALDGRVHGELDRRAQDGRHDHRRFQPRLHRPCRTHDHPCLRLHQLLGHRDRDGTDGDGYPSTDSAGTCAVAAGSAAATFTVVGLTNPAAATYAANTFSIKTSADVTVANPASTVTIGTPRRSRRRSPSSARRRPPLAHATWTVGFAASATGGLAAGDTITAAFNAGFTVPGTPEVALVSGFTNCSATATAAAQTVTVTLADSGGTCAVAGSAAATFTLEGLTNPAAAALTGTTFTVQTSADTGTASPATVTIAAATAPTAVTFADVAHADATRALWTVGWTPSATGLLEDGDTITVTFESTFTVDPNPVITLGPQFTNCSAVGVGSGNVATITLADSGGTCSETTAATTMTILGASAPAPAKQGLNYSVKTSSDTTALAATGTLGTYGPATASTITAFTGSPQKASARSTWTVTFTSGANGYLRTGETLTVTFGAGYVVPASPTVVLASPFSTDHCALASASDVGQVVTITLAEHRRQLPLFRRRPPESPSTIAGITNPAVASADTLSTSSDSTAASTTPTIAAAGTPTAVTVSSTSLAASAKATWTTNFSATSTGALEGGDTITVTFSAGFAVPPTPAITLGERVHHLLGDGDQFRHRRDDPRSPTTAGRCAVASLAAPRCR